MTERDGDPGVVARLEGVWRRHGRLFWILHSIWALATGVFVIVLAHERYGFVPWVVGFLGLTWASTLFFSQPVLDGREEGVGRRVGRGLASYGTRVLYQETLFFLIPFYAYSAVSTSWNVLFVVLLAALAGLACLDLVFDRWLRESPVFGLLFFASVAFAALNLLLPLLAGLPPSVATPVAAVAAVASSAPLALQGGARGSAARVRLGAAALALLALTILARPLIPPVPLRLHRAVFAGSVDPETLAPRRVLGSEEDAAALPDGLAVLVEVFAPSALPTHVAMEWTRDGEALRTSREVAITAHRAGFRVWDRYAPETGPLRAGRYRVVLRTGEGQDFGAIAVTLRGGAGSAPEAAGRRARGRGIGVAGQAPPR